MPPLLVAQLCLMQTARCNSDLPRVAIALASRLRHVHATTAAARSASLHHTATACRLRSDRKPAVRSDPDTRCFPRQHGTMRRAAARAAHSSAVSRPALDAPLSSSALSTLRLTTIGGIVQALQTCAACCACQRRSCPLAGFKIGAAHALAHWKCIASAAAGLDTVMACRLGGTMVVAHGMDRRAHLVCWQRQRSPWCVLEAAASDLLEFATALTNGLLIKKSASLQVLIEAFNMKAAPNGPSSNFRALTQYPAASFTLRWHLQICVDASLQPAQPLQRTRSQPAREPSLLRSLHNPPHHHLDPAAQVWLPPKSSASSAGPSERMPAAGAISQHPYSAHTLHRALSPQ
jgi:hypothetical protein